MHTHGSHSWRYKNDIFFEEDVENVLEKRKDEKLKCFIK